MNGSLCLLPLMRWYSCAAPILIDMGVSPVIMKRASFDTLRYALAICMYVCMYVCVSVYVCMYVCVCMYVYYIMSVSMYVCVYYVCMCVHVCVLRYVCMYVCMYVCIYVCMCVCMYVCICMCVYVCVCMYVCVQGVAIKKLLLLLISGHVDDEEEGRALTRGLPSTVTKRFIHAHRLVWP